jgi:hypothetical protein
MKKLTLALVLALCGARAYGEQAAPVVTPATPEQAVSQEMEKLAKMADENTVRSAIEDLNLDQETKTGILNWVKNHKALVGACTALVAGYAGIGTAYAFYGDTSEEGKWSEKSRVKTLLGRCGRAYPFLNSGSARAEAKAKAEEDKEEEAAPKAEEPKKKEEAPKKDDASVKPGWFASQSTVLKATEITGCAVAALALGIAFEIYFRGENAWSKKIWNKLFGKKVEAPKEEAATPAPAV